MPLPKFEKSRNYNLLFKEVFVNAASELETIRQSGKDEKEREGLLKLTGLTAACVWGGTIATNSTVENVPTLRNLWGKGGKEQALALTRLYGLVVMSFVHPGSVVAHGMYRELAEKARKMTAKQQKEILEINEVQNKSVDLFVHSLGFQPSTADHDLFFEIDMQLAHEELHDWQPGILPLVIYVRARSILRGVDIPPITSPALPLKTSVAVLSAFIPYGRENLPRGRELLAAGSAGSATQGIIQQAVRSAEDYLDTAKKVGYIPR